MFLVGDISVVGNGDCSWFDFYQNDFPIGYWSVLSGTVQWYFSPNSKIFTDIHSMQDVLNTLVTK